MELSNPLELSPITMEDPKDSDMLNSKLFLKPTLPSLLTETKLMKENLRLTSVPKDLINLLKELPLKPIDPEEITDKEKLQVEPPEKREKKDNKNPELKLPEKTLPLFSSET